MRSWLCLPWFLIVACAQGESAAPASRARAEDVRSSAQEDEEGADQDRGGVEVVDASMARRASPAKATDAGQPRTGGSQAAGAGGSRARDAGAPVARVMDAGLKDAGRPAERRDAGSANSSDPEPEPEPSTTPPNTGSCCSASTGPGCGDATLQACVCALSPRCCSETWDESCARLVREKNCQRGVRDCVCGSADGQWQQAYCCEGGWNATCESVSIHKCGATAACP